MCKTEITPRNETLDAVCIVYLLILCVVLVKVYLNTKRKERVLFFTLTPEGDIGEAEEVTLDGDSGPQATHAG